ncbi:hypothetical protein ACS0TY_010303 [Phlomoides rotata]
MTIDTVGKKNVHSHCPTVLTAEVAQKSIELQGTSTVNFLRNTLPTARMPL